MWVPYHRGLVLPKKPNKVESFLLNKPKTKKIDGTNVFVGSGLEIGHSSMQGKLIYFIGVI